MMREANDLFELNEDLLQLYNEKQSWLLIWGGITVKTLTGNIYCCLSRIISGIVL